MTVGVSLDGVIEIVQLLFGVSQIPEGFGILHVHPAMDQVEVGIEIE